MPIQKMLRKSQVWASHGRMSGLWQIAKCVLYNKAVHRRADMRRKINEAVEQARLQRRGA